MFEPRYTEEPQFKPLEGVAKKAKYLIYANAGVGIVGAPILMGFVDHSKLTDPGMVTRGLLASVLFCGELFTWIVGGIFFLVWMYRAQINALRLLSKEPPSLQAEKTAAINTIGWWFIPIANLWKPYENIKNLWRATDPKAGCDANWRKFKVPNDITWWWGLWIVMQFTGRGPNDSFAGIMAGAGVRLITGILAVRIVSAITERQHHQIHMREAQAASEL
jgi:hypothetical protein